MQKSVGCKSLFKTLIMQNQNNSLSSDSNPLSSLDVWEDDLPERYPDLESIIL